MAQEGQQEGQQGLGRALVVPAHAPDHVAPCHAAQNGTRTKEMVTEPLAEGARALSCCGWMIQPKRGPILVQAWVEMFKHVRGGTRGSRQMKKSLPKAALTQVSSPQQQGRAGWGGSQEKGTSQEETCLTPLPKL